MKKIYFIALMALVFCLKAMAQPYQIGGIIGHHFLQGVTGVTNTFRTMPSSFPAATTDVKFIISDVGYTTAYTSGWGIYNSTYDDYSLDIDMGSLPSNAPENLVAYASYYDGNGPIAGGTFSDNWALTLTPTPTWVNGTYQGQVAIDSVNYTNNLLEMNGQLPLSNLLGSNQSVSGIIGLAGKPFNITNPNLDFHITYNMATGISTGAQTTIGGNFEPLGNTNSVLSNSNFSGVLSFDSAFNLTFNGTALWEPTPISKSYEFKAVPLAGANFHIGSIGALCVNTSLEFSLAAKIKAQIYAGYDVGSGQWGFKRNGTDVTQLLGKVTASATAKGELKAVCGSLFGFNIGIGTIARGEVTADLTIGGGVQYYNIPTPTPTTLSYGEFNIHAEGEVLGFGAKSGDYIPAPWGNVNDFNFKKENSVNDFFESNTYGARSLQTPGAWPMGKISTRDSVLASAWIDDINFGNGSALLVSYYSPLTNTFSTPIIVAQNDSGIANHSISLLPNKNIFITWSQLNKPSSQIGSMSLDAISKSQDIFIAIVDINSNTVVYKAKLADTNNDKADGEPRIHWGNGNQGIITWQRGDNTNMGSDIYAERIVESGGNYTIYLPDTLSIGTTGFNYDVNVAYTNGSNAIATWLNDPDMDETTNNEEVYYSLWNGSAWQINPSPRFTVPPGYELKDYSLGTSDNYGIEALTYHYYASDSTLVNGVYLGRWTDGNPDGGTYATDQQEDATYNFQLPRVSVSKNGIASLVILIRDLLDPNADGMLNLYLKDLNSGTAWQNVEQTNPQYGQFISDTSEFVWDMSAKFGYLGSANSSDIMYVFTQEMDNVGNTNPTYGEVFGNPNLNLVLRAFKLINSGGTITLADVVEPTTENITGFYQELSPFNTSFELKPNFPNPFNDETNLPFHLYKGGKVLIELFNLNGQSLGKIFDAELSAGDYVTKFNRRNLASGLYFYKIKVDEYTQTGKMIITD